jgi:signal recognition particle receptor subunit beta
VDGVVFVADSQEMRRDANIESVENLKTNLRDNGHELGSVPYVLQLNKRDLPGVMPVERLVGDLRVRDETVLEAVATKGVGVFDTLKTIIRLVLNDLRRR